jgi:hypothetical protein
MCYCVGALVLAATLLVLACLRMAHDADARTDALMRELRGK